MLLKLDSISWRKILQNSHNSQMQWPVVSTLCQETKKHLHQKVGSEGKPKLDPYWKLQLVVCKVNMELRSELCLWTKDNFHSWVRISHALNKLVTNLNNNEQENSEVQFEEYALKLNAGDFASRSEGQSKTTKTRFCQLIHKNFSYWGKNLDRCWTRRIFFLLLWSVKEIDSCSSSWKSTPRRRWSDWILENQRQSSETFLVLSSLVWRKVEEKHGKRRRKQEKDTNIVLIHYEQSCTSELFKVIQDAVSLILLYRTMSLFRTVSSSTFLMSDVQSIYIPSSIQDWYREVNILSNRQTVFFLPVDPMDKNHKDPDTIDLEAPRLAQYMHKAWKKHQNTVYWVDFNHALTKGLKFYQTRSNAVILHETLPAYCIPKVVRMETGEVTYKKVYESPRPPPKISLNHDWMKELGSQVARHPEGEVVQQTKSFQSSQPNPNPDHDRTEKPRWFALNEEHPVLRSSKHVLFVKKLWNMIERGNPLFAVTQVTSKATTTDSLKARAQQATRNVTMIKLGLLKSGNLMNWWMIERWNPFFALKEEHSNSSLGTMKQNQICRWDPDHSWIGWMIKCEKRQKRSSMNVAEDSDKTFCDMENVHVFNIGIICIHGKELLRQLSIHREHNRSHTQTSRIQQISQWNKCSTYLRKWCPNKMRSMLWSENNWFGKLFMKVFLFDWWWTSHQCLQRTKVYVFSDSVLCLGKIHENPQSNTAWEQRLEWFKSSPEYRTLDIIDGEPMEFEWNIFPGFNTLQLSQEVQELLLRLGETPENFTRRFLFHVNVQRHLLWIKRQQDRMRVKCSTSFLHFQEDLEQDNGHFSVLVQRKSGILSVKMVH